MVKQVQKKSAPKTGMIKLLNSFAFEKLNCFFHIFEVSCNLRQIQALNINP